MSAPTTVFLLAAGSTFEQLLLAGIILAAMALYMGQWLPSETVSLLLLCALGASGILDPGETLSGFSNSATITVAALFVVSSGLLRTGVLETVTLRMADFARGSLARALLVLALVVPPASAFVNNTPIVVMMVPVVLSLCRRFDIRPSKLMIPLSYLAILGGTCTLFGTSTNILVNDLYRSFAVRNAAEWGGVMPLRSEGFGIFDFTPVGAVFLSIGGLFLLLTARRLLPDRASLSGLLELGRKAAFVTEVVVRPDSPWIGRTVGEVFESSPVRLLEVVKGEEILLPDQARNLKVEPEMAFIIEGKPPDINAFVETGAADLASVVEDDARVPMRTIELMLAEAVVLPDSPFEGRTVRELGLNRLYGVKIMAVQRHGRQHRYRIRNMRLHAGDVLLVQADAVGLNALRESEAVLVVEGVDRTVVNTRKAPLALAILMGVVVLATTGALPIVLAALLGAGGMLLSRCLRVDEAMRSLDAAVLFLLAATIPLGLALEKTGLAREIVEVTVAAFGPETHPVLLISLFYLLTTLLTGFLSNNAVAVLLVPIAFEVAHEFRINHEALLMAVAYGASASFLTPIGYQTNTIVMGPGGYTFRDYLRIGVPMTILLWIAATVTIPFFWPPSP